MVIYNVTVKVQTAIHQQWLEWLKDIHIPEIIATGCFEKATISRLLEVDESDGPTFTVQYFAAEKQDYDRYIDSHAISMRDKAMKEWGNQFIAFRTIMEVVH